MATVTMWDEERYSFHKPLTRGGNVHFGEIIAIWKIKTLHQKQ